MDMFEKEAVAQASIFPIILLLALITGLVGPQLWSKIEPSMISEVKIINKKYKSN